MKLEDQIVSNFKITRIFREHQDKITAMDFSSNGEKLIACSEDDQIIVYDCRKGSRKGLVYSRKYGADLIHFTHAKNAVLYSSTKVNNIIRYLSLYDNKFIRLFPGHSKRVSSLSLSPINDSFISSSLDNTIRLWDLKSSNCEGLLRLSDRAIATFDPEGLLFAVAIGSKRIKLYDLRNFSKGPFVTFNMMQETACNWTGLKFSPDGNTILISTNGSVIRLMDSFTGAPLHTLSGYLNNKGIPLEASYSPDSKFVFSGSTDGRVHVWNAVTGYAVCVLNANHPGPVQCVQFNPKYTLLASACTNMAFWIPGEMS